MPTQLQLEGPDLESLLARVKSELGLGARIVRAEKVRTGGIAGFFAKQRFEVTVEVADEAAAAPAPTPAPTPATPMSLLDLADQVSDSEHSSGLSLGLRGATTATPAPTPAPAAAPAPAPAATAPQPVSVPTQPVGTPVQPVEPAAARSTSFAAVLANLGAATGSGPAAAERPAAPQPAPQQVTPQPEPAAPAPSTVQDDVVDTDRVPAPEPLPAQLVALEQASLHVSTEGSTFAALLDELSAATGVPTSVPSATAVAGVVDIPAARTGEAPATAVRTMLPVHLPFGLVAAPATVSGQLARLGLPAHLQPAETDSALYPALLQSLSSLPEAPAPDKRAGGVLAIVGPLAQSLQAGRLLARELGLPAASGVVLATSPRTLTDLPERQVLRDCDSAEARRSTWSRRRNLTIVAVDAPMTAAGALQARAYLSALQPSATWGAVEATRKPHDVGAFARSVGGFQALALSAVEETSDPAAVLELGIPVARLNEQPATASAWAALLSGRVAA